MRFIDVITYILIFVGTVLNLTFGICYKTNLEKIAIVNIIFTVVFLGLSVIAKIVFNLDKNKESNLKYNESKDVSTFQIDIPPISDEELKEINEEKDFEEVDLAELYIKNNIAD